jgi:hypothetical protein
LDNDKVIPVKSLQPISFSNYKGELGNNGVIKFDLGNHRISIDLINGLITCDTHKDIEIKVDEISQLPEALQSLKSKLGVKSFSNCSQELKSFSDWDQIRNSVKDQYPQLKFEKVRGSDTDKSYKVKITDRAGKGRIIEVKKNPKKSALDNWVESSNMKVDNTARPKLSKEKIDKYKEDKVTKGYNPEQLKLAKLADDKDWTIREKVAKNPSTPSEVLKKLSLDRYEIRRKVASNPNTPADVLKKLANDDEAWIRYNVAENPSTPIDVLRKLADSYDFSSEDDLDDDAVDMDNVNRDVALAAMQSLRKRTPRVGGKISLSEIMSGKPYG